ERNAFADERVVDLDRRSVGDGHRALDDVLELLDVARPVVALEAPDGVLRQPGDPSIEPPRLPLDEVLRERADVVDALDERRHANRARAQETIELRIELSFPDLLGEIAG